MLGLFGLIGALFAGVVADSVFRMTEPKNEADDADENATDTEVVSDQPNIFGMFPLHDAENVDDEAANKAAVILEDDGMPLSTDLPDPADPDLYLVGGTGPDNLGGTGGNDMISGAAGDDFLTGRAGADNLLGGDGDDYLYGGSGDDSLQGDAGNDVLHGETGNDEMAGGDGNDALFGHEGDDALVGGAGHDQLQGGNGFDSLLGGAGDDALNGGYGRDLLAGGVGSDILDGGVGSDTIWGQWPEETDIDVDFLNGGDGDDLLMLGAGDFGSGGAGEDVFALLDIGANDPPMQITDFDPTQDQLIVLYDASLHPAPQLTFETDLQGSATRLLLDGVTVANLTNVTSLDLDAVTLRAA